MDSDRDIDRDVRTGTDGQSEHGMDSGIATEAVVRQVGLHQHQLANRELDIHHLNKRGIYVINGCGIYVTNGWGNFVIIGLGSYGEVTCFSVNMLQKHWSSGCFDMKP